MSFYGTKKRAEQLAKELNIEIAYENRGYFIFETKLQAVIYEFDEDWDVISDQCDPYPFLKNTNPEMKRLTKKAVNNLVKSLNEEKIDFDDVCDAACHLR
jgi:hypothetical protein